MPKKVKAIVRFETDCGNGRLNIRVGRWQEAWEDFHKCCSNFSIAKRTKSRWAETLKVEGESVEAEEDANILLMLKKTLESPPRNDVSEIFCIASCTAPVKEADGASATSTDASTVTEEEGVVEAL